MLLQPKAAFPQSLQSLKDAKTSTQREPQLPCELNTGREQTIQSSVSEKVTEENSHHKVISTSQELLVSGPVPSLTLSEFSEVPSFLLFTTSSHILDTYDLQIPAATPPSDWLVKATLLPKTGLVGSKWETFLNAIGFIGN